MTKHKNQEGHKIIRGPGKKGSAKKPTKTGAKKNPGDKPDGDVEEEGQNPEDDDQEENDDPADNSLEHGEGVGETADADNQKADEVSNQEVVIDKTASFKASIAEARKEKAERRKRGLIEKRANKMSNQEVVHAAEVIDKTASFQASIAEARQERAERRKRELLEKRASCDNPSDDEFDFDLF